MSIIYGVISGHRTDAAAPAHGQSATGYGSRIPTRHMVQLNGSARWRRVYAMRYGNAVSLYVTVQGRDVFLRDSDLLT
jgi:hypothetical protein